VGKKNHHAIRGEKPLFANRVKHFLRGEEKKNSIIVTKGGKEQFLGLTERKKKRRSGGTLLLTPTKEPVLLFPDDWRGERKTLAVQFEKEDRGGKELGRE